MHYLQNRWRLEGKSLIYYGLRNQSNLFLNKIDISKKQAQLISRLPKILNADEKKLLGKLLTDIVVNRDLLRSVPHSLEAATFCRQCCANDFMIPGMEFDENGLCPMCQTAEATKHLRSVVPLIKEIPRSKTSRFDVAVFYTGGKDSTYLLYHLAKRKGLRVLALTWEIPFQSESARQSIENAKRHLDTVEFITRCVKTEDMQKIYRKLYQLSENTCACPSLAYLLFYPELVTNRVPYFLAGNEPAQMLGLFYNHMAPKFAYTFPEKRLLQGMVNAGRLLSLHPPLKKGQLHTLAVMKQLAYGDNPLKKLTGYSNELVTNVVEAIHEVPELLPPLRRSIRASSWSGNIPAFVHIDLDAISGGNYNWNAVKDEIVTHCGWVAPENKGKGLHTSCQIEKCKEYSQFIRFYHCKSRMIPFSAIEISIASRNRNLSREQAIREIKQSLGFSLTQIPECRLMHDYLQETI